MLIDEIKRIVNEIPAQLKESKGVFSLEFTIIAERKVILSRMKLTYCAKFRIAEGFTYH